MRHASTLVFAVVLTSLFGGCHKTQIRSPHAQPVGLTHEDRQWFTVGGLVGLSGAAGDECRGQGVAHATSRASGWDILIDAGIGIVAGIVGSEVCSDIDDRKEYAACVSMMAGAGPLLISARTVTYRCSGGEVVKTLPLLPQPGGQPNGAPPGR